MKRRRLEGKTDYLARIALLKSGKPRIVFRKTNKYIIGQYLVSVEAQDKVLIGVSSKELLEYGWPENSAGSLKSLPACYLTGLLLGKKIKDYIKGVVNKKNFSSYGEVEAIFDIGLIRNLPKSRAYAFLNGVIDAGIKVPHKKEIFPDEKRLKGNHLKNKNVNFEKIKSSLK